MPPRPAADDRAPRLISRAGQGPNGGWRGVRGFPAEAASPVVRAV